MQALFVYGTLAPGEANHHVVEHITGSWVRATVRGTLLEEGWGAAMGCPGIVLAEDGAVVEGYVFSSDDLPSHWPMLDDFEGDGYERVTAKARLEDGREVETYIYALRQG